MRDPGDLAAHHPSERGPDAPGGGFVPASAVLAPADLDAVFSAVGHAVVVREASGRVVYANPAAVALHGHPNVDVFRSALEAPGCYEVRDASGAILPPDRWPWARAMRGERVEEVELHVRRLDTGRSWTGLYAARTLPAAGGRGLVVVTIQDVTEQRRIERELRATTEQAVRNAAELQTLLDTVPAAVFITRDLQARHATANRFGAELLRISPYQNASKTAPPDERPSYRVLVDGLNTPPEELPLQRAARLGVEVRDVEASVELEDGSVRYLLGSASPLRGPAGERAGAIGAFVDITDRKRTEEALRVAEERLRLAQEASRAGTYEWDLRMGKLYWSESLWSMYGVDPEEHGGVTSYELWLSTIAPEDRERIAQTVDAAVRASLDVDLEWRSRGSDGTVRWFLGRGSPVLDAAGQVLRYRGISMDITERKRMEEELRASRVELRALAARLDSVREEEQLRIARDLHDDMGQLLTAVKMDLRWIERRVDDLAPELRAPLLERTVDAAALVDQAIASTRKLAADLRPGALDRLGLHAALQGEARRFAARTGTSCEVAGPDDLPPIREETATALYRIALEALTNVARHAHARHVRIELVAMASSVVLRIEDDGCGVGDGAAGKATIGIAGMRERAERLGGEVRVEERPAGGTIVTATLPR